MPDHDTAAQRLGMLRWIAGVGAVTAEALAILEDRPLARARARLAAARRAGLLERHRPLAGRPALYTITRAGLRAAAVDRLAPCTVTNANAAHAIACAAAAAALARRYPSHRVAGECELRRRRRDDGDRAVLATLPTVGGREAPHRPDLVLWPASTDGRPVAVEVELSVKAPRRLAAICLAWARCREVAGVLYLTAPQVQPAVERAIAAAHGHERIVALPLEDLVGAGEPSPCGPSVPGGG